MLFEKNQKNWIFGGFHISEAIRNIKEAERRGEALTSLSETFGAGVRGHGETRNPEQSPKMLCLSGETTQQDHQSPMQLHRFFFFFLLFYRLASRAFVPCTATMEQVKEKGSELTVQGVFKGKTPNGELHALVLLDWAGG